jgi:serine/threonine protein kinase
MYMQIIQRLSYGPEVDWWSVGVVTYLLMMGHLPFDQETFCYDVLHYPMRYPWGLSRNAKSILQMVSTVNIKTEASGVPYTLFKVVFFHIYRH